MSWAICLALLLLAAPQVPVHSHLPPRLRPCFRLSRSLSSEDMALEHPGKKEKPVALVQHAPRPPADLILPLPSLPSMDADSDSDDGAGGAPELALYCRFLSYFAFTYGIANDGETVTILARDFWESYKTWAKRNHFKLKSNAAEFAKEITDFAALQDSGVSKARQANNLLVFTINPTKLHECLRANSMLDHDVW